MYEKPIVAVNESLAEGVFMASGSTVGNPDEWTCMVNCLQQWNGSHAIFEVRALYSGEKADGNVEVTITFNKNIADNAYAMGSKCSVNGTKVTLNASYSGSMFSDKFFVSAGSQEETMGLSAMESSAVTK